MPYVREKRVPGKDGKVYRYFQLVEGKRVDGRVRQHVIAHLGKHDSMEDARAAAEGVVPKEENGGLKELHAVNAEYIVHFRAYISRSRESNESHYELKSLKGQRPRAATAQRTKLKEQLAAISVHHEKAETAFERAVRIFDALTPKEQEQAREQNLAVVGYLEDQRRRRASGRF